MFQGLDFVLSFIALQETKSRKKTKHLRHFSHSNKLRLSSETDEQRKDGKLIVSNSFLGSIPDKLVGLMNDCFN